MKRILAALIIMAAAILTGCSAAAEEEEYRVLKVDSSSGTVIVERDSEAIGVFGGMNLVSEDYITVNESSSVLLLADSDKHIAAEENTEFRINASGTKDKGAITIELTKGKALFTIDEKLSEESSFAVKTPNAVLSVRGTTFMVYYDDAQDTTYLDVEQGMVRVETIYDSIIQDVPKGEKRVIRSDSISSIDSFTFETTVTSTELVTTTTSETVTTTEKTTAATSETESETSSAALTEPETSVQTTLPAAPVTTKPSETVTTTSPTTAKTVKETTVTTKKPVVTTTTAKVTTVKETTTVKTTMPEKVTTVPTSPAVTAVPTSPATTAGSTGGGAFGIQADTVPGTSGTFGTAGTTFFDAKYTNSIFIPDDDITMNP